MNTSTNTDIRKRAKKGIDRADDTTVKMILAMLEVQTEEETAFEKEMLRRIDDYEQERIIPISLDEIEKRVRSSHKKRMQSQK